MKLAQAIEIANRPLPPDSAVRAIALVCGFTPLYLETYLKAFAGLRFPEARVEITTGLFGDLLGNLELAADGRVGEAALTLEWSDIDPRLGRRHAGGWGERALSEILDDSRRMFDRLFGALEKIECRATVALCPPGSPFPPVGHVSPAQASSLELDLNMQLADFLKRAAALSGVRVLSRQYLDETCPPGDRLDVGLDLNSGFPWRASYAAKVAEAFVDVLFPKTPRKALITDLDDVLWRGLAGEAGVDGISWSLDAHTQAHALYQQALSALADYGVLIGCASKNDPELIRSVFRRQDLLLREDQIFPFEVNWGAKSESVGRILKAWNIAADAVVFVDDSPIELDEVKAKFPGIECLLFHTRNAESIWSLLKQLRSFFGKPYLLDEDRIRLRSLRDAGALPAEGIVGASTEFLAQVSATITFDRRKNHLDPRPLELINKTNQFNLNGRRWTEAEWRVRLGDPHGFALTVSYEDKFGPLGKIAILSGMIADSQAVVDTWVMSCRAFSRRIEHHTLDYLFGGFNVDEILLAYSATDLNKPLQSFLETVAVVSDSACNPAPVRIARREFMEKRPALPHLVKDIP
jgi:FkbH-like protein